MSRKNPKAVKVNRRETGWFFVENDVIVWDPEPCPARSTSLISWSLTWPGVDIF